VPAIFTPEGFLNSGIFFIKKIMSLQHGIEDVFDVTGCRSCSVLRVRYGTADKMNAAFAVYCSVSQCVSLRYKFCYVVNFAVFYNLLFQSVRYGTADKSNVQSVAAAVCCSTLQLQCAAVCCSAIHVRHGTANTSNILTQR